MGMRGFDRRNALLKQVEAVFASAADGKIPNTAETEGLDFKEEPGRRHGPDLLPGKTENPAGAVQLADEVACMANTAGGGVLIVGVEDRTGRVIGTALDVDWLRQRINSAVGVAPDITAHEVDGQRVLVLLVAEAREPVENSAGALRWRVGDSCVPVDRAQWWEHRAVAQNLDPMAVASSLVFADIRPMALEICRRWAGSFPAAETDQEFLTRIGAVRSDGFLTQAAALLLCPLQRPGITLTHLSVPGGSVLNFVEYPEGQSLAEHIDQVENAMALLNTRITLEQGLSHRQVHRVPPSAIREAILNGVIHRDWNRHTPTEVRWIEADSMVEVRSPGGFPAGINENNLLSQREARYPALADLFRAIGLVDKQGVGIDRMYRAMIQFGHRPPEICEMQGIFVQVTLVGGQPKLPVLKLMDGIRPVERQADYRLSIVIYELLHKPFISISSLATALQSTAESATTTIEVALQTVIAGQPLIQPFQDVWRLGDTALGILREDQQVKGPFALLPYVGSDEFAARQTLRYWLSMHESISTGELMVLTGMARGTAKKLLDGFSAQGIVAAVGQGRASRYEAAPH